MIEKKVTVAFCSANPTDAARIELEEEQRQIRHRLDASDFGSRIEMVTVPAATADDLLQAFNKLQPHALHFAGHGSEDGVILRNANGESTSVSGAALAALFAVLGDRLRVVLLNCCYSAEQASEIAEQVDTVIAMDTAISDNAAITFAAAFYRAIGFGRSIKNAFEQGRVALQLAGMSENVAVRLFVRAGCDPDEVHLIEPSQEDTQPTAVLLDSATSIVPPPLDCRHCQGTGVCKNGTGRIWSCHSCQKADGAGPTAIVMCSLCSGTGRVLPASSVDVTGDS